MEGTQEKTINIAPIVLGVLLIAAGALGWFFLRPRTEVVKDSGGASQQIEEPQVHGTASHEALQTALQAAKKWQADAQLLRVDPAGIDERGRSSVWRGIFVSPGISSRGYAVSVNGGAVISAEEIAVSGNTVGSSAERLITSEEAIAKVREIPGYETIKILGAEAFYDQDAKMWFWGIKTERNVISIKASR